MLGHRLIFSTILIGFITVALLIDQWLETDVAFTVIFGLFVVVATKELFDLTRQKGHTPFATLGIVTVAALVLAYWIDYNYVHEARWVYIVVFVFILGLFVCQAFLSPRKAGVVSMSLTTFAVIYIWVLGGFIQRMNYIEGVGLRGVILFLITVKSADIAAYLVGRRLGKHHPFRKLSPGKSAEGYAAGLMLSVLVSVVLGLILFDGFDWYHWVGFGVLMWFFGGMGDLFESAIKRDLNAKDSATTIPGLGGVFDQLDSVLLAGPVAYLMLANLAQTSLL